jgi:hypothetical protein
MRSSPIIRSRNTAAYAGKIELAGKRGGSPGLCRKTYERERLLAVARSDRVPGLAQEAHQVLAHVGVVVRVRHGTARVRSALAGPARNLGADA